MRRGGGHDRGIRPAHDGWLHNLFAHDPWIAWPLAGLAIAALVVILTGRAIFRSLGDLPWWARLSLVGVGFLWWRGRRRRRLGY